MATPEQPADPPGPAETTNPLPAVPAEHGRPAAPVPITENQLTTGLPLLDLLAPKQAAEAASFGQHGPSVPPSQPMPAVPAVPQVPAQAGPTTPPGPAYPGALPGPAPTLMQPAVPAPPLQPPVGPPGQPMLPGMTGPPMTGPPMMGPPVMPPPRRSGPRDWRLVAAVAGGVLLVGLLAWAVIASGSSPEDDQAGPQTNQPAPTSPVRTADGFEFTQHAARTDTDCAGNSYGQVVDFFRQHSCTELRRKLFLTAVDGRPVVVSVVAVELPDEGTATQLQQLVDTSGTGNVADLLRAGVRVPDGPNELTNAGYASHRDGATVVIVESSYGDPSLSRDEPLDRICQAALKLAG